MNERMRKANVSSKEGRLSVVNVRWVDQSHAAEWDCGYNPITNLRVENLKKTMLMRTYEKTSC